MTGMTRLSPFAYLAAGCLLAGCGSGDETESYSLVSASGTITHNGKPLEGAQVVFTPDPGNKPNTPAQGSTGPDGKYSLAYRGRPGVALGKYQVDVQKQVGAAGGGSQDPYMSSVALDSQPASAAAGKNAPPKPAMIEGRFSAEVKGARTDLNFDVKGAAK
jgi:hypothetical protein